jgi:colicin import membrane protein
MKKFLIGLLIVAGALAVISMVAKRRSESGTDEWGSFADDSAARASKATETVTEAAKDAASKVADTAKEAATKVTDATKEAATKATEASKEAASKVADAAKNA